MARQSLVLQDGVLIGKVLLSCMSRLLMGKGLPRIMRKLKLRLRKLQKGKRCSLRILISPWDAAKHMKSAAVLAKDLGNWIEVADFYRKASELYTECGRPQPASDALAKAARSISHSSAFSALEDADPDDAIQLYTDACDILEEDGKEQMAFDLYRAAVNVYIKLEK
ncbi:hypothetical protein Pint_11422 [Pistacia integerrima]|uniref:Uncharacterized protein n=1 Tax=Pistacia integerrima TaxID=434235 RepID=A0ACC0XKQ5_9ROSI|nr:hypothetical protein Pint_11422 [Pistacia integerrima]